jgi:hypothetical protein
MAKRGRPYKEPDKVSHESIRRAMADSAALTDLEKRSRHLIKPGELTRFVLEESARTGICRTKLFEMIERIRRRRATGIIWLSGHRDTHGKKKP